MKRKELQQFSKEVLAAAIVGLSVAGTSMTTQAAENVDNASVIAQQDGAGSKEDTTKESQIIDESKCADVNQKDAENQNSEVNTENISKKYDEENESEIVEKETDNQSNIKSTEASSIDERKNLEISNSDTILEEDKSVEEKSGWVEEDGKWYYYDLGSKRMNNEYYLSDGSEWYWYRFDENGRRLTSEWYTDSDGSEYYYDEEGKQVSSGVITINDKKYCFNDNGYLVKNGTYMKYGGTNTRTVYYRTNENGEVRTGWYTDSDGSKYYYNENGESVTGIVTVEGKKYYFNYEGKLNTGNNYTIGGYNGNEEKYIYYRVNENGEIITGWYTDSDGNKYYYDEEGKSVDGIVSINGKMYYFNYEGKLDVGENYTFEKYDETSDRYVYYRVNEKGEIVTGWYTDSAGNKYYYDEEGKSAYRITEISNKKYLFDKEGMLEKNSESFLEGTGDIAGYYRTNDNGEIITGWYTDRNGSKYYYDENGKGAMQLTEIDGKTYYFNEDGSLCKNRTLVDSDIFMKIDENGNVAYSKKVTNNSWVKDNDGSYYYIRNNDIVKNEFITSNNKKYYVDYDGKMLANTSRQLYDSESSSYEYYRFDEAGAIIKGWYKESSSWYYYDVASGKAVSGVKIVNGKTYLFSYNGMMVTDVVRVIDGTFYKFGHSGEVEFSKTVENKELVSVGNDKYYVDNGQLITNKLVEVDGHRYYFDWDGKQVKNNLQQIWEENQGYYYCLFDKNGEMLYGWQNYYGQKYYFDTTTGHAYEGFKVVNGVEYYFEPNLVTDSSREVDGKLCYFDKDGKLVKKSAIPQNGWIKMPDGWYYSKNGELLKNEYLTIKDKTYYLGYKGRMLTNDTVGTYDDESGMYVYHRFNESGEMVTGWYKDEYNNWYYYDKKGRGVQGIQVIGGNTYYFDEQSKMCTDVSVEVEQYLYYFDKEGYVQKKKKITNGWIEMPDGWYYAKGNQLIKNEWIVINNRKYYLGYDGKMYSDVLYRDVNGVYYFLKSSGEAAIGWYEYEGVRYYFDSEGRGAQGIKKIDGKTYYFSEYAVMQKDISIDNAGYIYYFGKDGVQSGEVKKIDKDGWIKMLDGWYYAKDRKLLKNQWISNHKYYLDDNGRMYADRMEYIWEKNGESGLYYFNSDGSMHTGWLYKYGTTYYFKKDGQAVRNQVYEIDGKIYGFADGGNLVKQKSMLINNMLYYFDKEGITSNSQGTDISRGGWIKMPNGWYYAKNNTILTSQWLTLSSGKYYFDYDGLMYSDTEMWFYDEGHSGYCYRFDKNGAMVTGMYKDAKGRSYYYDQDGKCLMGFITINGKNYYADTRTNGEFVTNKNLYANGKLYTADKNGVCQLINKTGWIDDTYYCTNGIASIGWKAINGKWYYFDLDTAMKKYGEKIEISNKQYVLLSDGTMKTGWIKNEKGGYYFANKDGALLKDTWLKLNNTWYYFKDINMVSGIVSVNGKNELFASDGRWISTWNSTGNTGWKEYNSDWYYVENGTLLMDTVKKIGNDIYGFDSEGRMIKNHSYNDQYYFDGAGKALVSKWQKENLGQWRYYNDDGKCQKSGWKQLYNIWYYFMNGYAVTHDTVIDGKLYKFNNDGAYLNSSTELNNGWKLINGNYYYYENGDRVINEVKSINGRIYAFDYDGKMVVNSCWHNEKDDCVYSFDKNGELLKGWNADHTMYADNSGKLLTGLQTIDGKMYYFYYNVASRDIVSKDKKCLYVIDTKSKTVKETITASGTKWYQTSNGNWFYSKDGEFVSGDMYIINGEKYVFDVEGVMLKNKVIYGEGYLDNSGKLNINGWCDGIYFRNGIEGYGAQEIDGKYYYWDVNGDYTYSKEGVCFVDGAYYYYDGKGNREKLVLQNGWMKIHGEYYFVEKGAMTEDSNKIINGTEYYFDGLGRMLTSCWYGYYNSVSQEYITVYLDENGHLTKGWKVIENQKYYFDKNGCRVEGKQIIDGKNYLFDSNGALL